MLAVADAGAVRAALRPIAAAGIRVRSVVTPALALLSLARTRRAMATPDAIDAYVALEDTASCAVLVRNGLLVGAREIAWGYPRNEAGRLRPRLDVAARLADELAALFAAAGAPVRQVCICGGLADLRSTTMPLMERLDVEVETLDSLFAIDAAHLPEPADEFRERASALRLAWAVAADRRPPINLLRDEQPRLDARRARQRAAVVAEWRRPRRRVERRAQHRSGTVDAGAGATIARSRCRRRRPDRSRRCPDGSVLAIAAPARRRDARPGEPRVKRAAAPPAATPRPLDAALDTILYAPTVSWRSSTAASCSRATTSTARASSTSRRRACCCATRRAAARAHC